VADVQVHVRAHVIRVLFQALVQFFDRDHGVAPIEAVAMKDTAEQQVVGLLPRRTLGHGDALQIGFDLPGNGSGDVAA